MKTKESKKNKGENIDLLSLLAFNIEDAWRFIKFYESKNKNSDDILKILEKEDLNSLNKIADSCNKNIFDKKVIEAYWIGNELLEVFWKSKINKIPFHNLHILSTIKNHNCLITTGKVISVITNAHAVVLEKTIVLLNGKYSILEQERSIIYDKKLLSIKEGDLVLIHWGMARIKLNVSQEKNVLIYLRKIVRLTNSKKFK